MGDAVQRNLPYLLGSAHKEIRVSLVALLPAVGYCANEECREMARDAARECDGDPGCRDRALKALQDCKEANRRSEEALRQRYQMDQPRANQFRLQEGVMKGVR